MDSNRNYGYVEQVSPFLPLPLLLQSHVEVDQQQFTVNFPRCGQAKVQGRLQIHCSEMGGMDLQGTGTGSKQGSGIGDVMNQEATLELYHIHVGQATC